MSIFDDLGDALKSMGHTAGNTLGDIGGALAVPLTASFDIAKFPFDAATQGGGSSFHELVRDLAGEGNRLVRPFTDGDTWTGQALQKTSSAMNTAYEKAIDQPLSTLAMMDPSKTNWFDSQDWANAYKIAQHQSFGQSIFGATTNTEAQFIKNPSLMNGPNGQIATPASVSPHNALGTILAGATDFAIGWELDPTVLVGRTAGVLRQAKYLHQLGAYDRAGLLAKIGGEDPTGLGRYAIDKAMTNRVTGAWQFYRGDNKYGRALSTQEIYSTDQGLQRSSNGMTIASMLSTAAHIDDPVQSLATHRMIIAAAAGDPLAITALRAKSAAGNMIANGLTNILKGGPVDLETHGLNEWARFDPEMYADYQRQLADQDHGGDLTQFANDWIKKVQNTNRYTDLMIDTGARKAGLDYLPGRHDKTFGIANPLSSSNRALSRVNEQRLIDKGAEAHDAALQRVADWAQQPRSTVWQNGLAQVPLLIAKGVSKSLGWYDGRYFKSMSDSLRDPHYIGMVDVHDWNGSLRQLDAMLKQGHVSMETRQSIVDQASKAITEGDKMISTQVAVSAAMKGLADHYSPLLGGKKVDEGFIHQVVQKNMTKNAAALTSLNGTKYSAAELPDQLLNRPDIAQSIAAARSNADDLYYRGEQTFGADAVPQNHWRVDQVDEGDNLISMPLLESDLRNKILLPDMPTIEKALSREVTHARFQAYSEAWRMHANELSALQARVNTSAAAGTDLLQRAIKAKQVAMDGLIDAGSYITRAWKASVLFRLGFPQRVLADDHMRIANKLHWMREFAAPNTLGGAENMAYNHLPSFIPGTRGYAALQQWKQLRFERNRIAEAAGLTNNHTEDVLKEIQRVSAKATAKGATDADRAAYTKLVSDTGLDPEGMVSEWFDHRAKAKTFQNRITVKLRAIKRWETEGNTQKAAQGKLDIRDLEGSRDYHLDQMPTQDPFEVRQQLDEYDRQIGEGWRQLKEEKRRIGMKDITVKTPFGKIDTEGPMGPHGRHFEQLVSSNGTYDNLALGPEGEHSAIQRQGAWRTIQPNEPGYLEAWADILNHQIRNSALAMHVVRNPDATVQDIAQWIKDPDQSLLRQRMEHFAKDPEDWAGRVQQHVREYVPSEAVRQALIDGNVKASDLDRLIPEAVRPDIHGRSMDFNTGRSPASKLISSSYNAIFKALGEIPTDMLSRQPFFNAMYKKELRDIATTEIAHARVMGTDQFTEADLRSWETKARNKALNHVKSTLWDISAHSHAGHAMRFMSPFFTAHVEALSRWWRIANDDPSVLRKFNMAFDAPRRLGLVYDATTGEPVQPGEPITQNHRIVMELPLTGNAGIDRWLKKIGGGWKFSISENGLNVLLQNGIANPGTGPLITLPVTELAKRYADDPSITKFANMVNPYPKDGVLSSILPGSGVKFWDWMQSKSNNFNDSSYAQAYRMRLGDNIIDYLRDHDGQMPIDRPGDPAWSNITDAAGKQAQHDMYLQFLSSFVGFTPARAEDKYAVISQGWQQIQQVGRAQGKDYNWMVNKFREKYSDVYMPLLYSTSVDPGRLAGTPAEVSAVKQYRGLVGHLDNSRVVRAIVGPTAAQLASTDPQMGQVTKEARLWLTQQNVLRNGQALLNTKDPQKSATDGMVSEGWDAYDKAMNQLTVAAEKYGFVDSNGAVNWSSSKIQQAKQAMIQELGSTNQWWLNDYNARTGTNYDTIVSDLEKVATNKALVNDPERPDIKVLQQYLADRNKISEVLKVLALRGEVHSIGAKALAPLWSAFQQEVDQMRSKNTYFDQYAFNGLIEFDPMYQAGLKLGGGSAQ